MIKQNKKKYFQDVNNTSRSNPRKFWSELTSVIPKINERSIPRTMTANDFNIFLKSVPDKTSTMYDKGKPLLWNSAQSIHTFKFHEISRNDVLKFLKSLPKKSGMDIHGLYRKLLRLSSEHVVDSLSSIINSSLNLGRVFDDWKVARVTPVYKNSGDMHVMSNHRPISVIGHITKIVEQLISTQLVEYLDEHSFITPDQFAYLKGHSTQTCLHRVLDDWLENVNEGQITVMCMLDIAKCFDSIDHDLLLKKLSLYGIKNVENPLLQVYKSYIQPKLDYGLTIYGCTTQENLTLVQRLQNHAARLILGNFDYINFRGIELVNSLGLYTIEERRDYFLAMLMFKSIYGIAPAYLCNQIVMNFDTNGYDTRGTDGMNVYLPTLKKDTYKNSFLHKGGQVWNRLPDVVKDSTNLETFKYYYKLQKSVTDAWMLYSCIHVSILQCNGKLLNIITHV